MLCVVDEIEQFGAPRNLNAERPESLLIKAAKRPGRRAQKRHAACVYELQSAQRLAESFLIDLVHTCISGDNLFHDDPTSNSDNDDLVNSDDDDDNSDN